MTVLVLAALVGATWTHPAGMITDETLAEVRAKIESEGWAEQVYRARHRALDPWVDQPLEEVARQFPRRRGNVYHNFSCPDDRTRLRFDPFNSTSFQCDTCGRPFAPDTDPGIYPLDDPYHGTVYDGWACIFFQQASQVAADLGVMGRIDADDRRTRRAVDLLLLFADILPGMPKDREGQYARILTYHREGDNKILDNLAVAYELVRDRMTPEERALVESRAIERLLVDLMLEPFYPYDHNNVYQWHRTILQVAAALERDDLVDWCYGYGGYSPESLPEHRSLRRIVATHFKPDGAFWELCSGYHLYPMYAFCEIAVIARNLSRMDPDRFPPDRYDYSTRASDGGRAIHHALHWFLSMAMPDRTMTVVGDSTKARAGMDDYDMTAEVGYRYFGLRAIGDYRALREGRRGWTGLLFGAPRIEQRPTPFTSSYLSSGWVSLRGGTASDPVWVGLNALIPGGGHQHADRLTFTHFAQGTLLALEKATPYNEPVTRVLGTLTPSHNTVTVDRTSQKQGESLEDTEIPVVRRFFSNHWVKFAEAAADNLYQGTREYRRRVAIFEDVVLDVFNVQGGSTRDWMVQHGGLPPRLSVEGAEADFAPAEWLAQGESRAWRAATDEGWSAQWRVDEVTSRLTMLGSPGTEIYALRTYPVENAVVTAEHPPCPTLCVRRSGDAPFVAVWDAWRDGPNLQDVRSHKGPSALELVTRGSVYRVLLEPGRAELGEWTLSSDAEFCALRDGAAVFLAGGSSLTVEGPEGELDLRLDPPATVSLEYDDGVVTLEVSGDVQYDTFGGRDRYRDAPAVTLRVGGGLWPMREKRLRYAGYAVSLGRRTGRQTETTDRP